MDLHHLTKAVVLRYVYFDIDWYQIEKCKYYIVILLGKATRSYCGNLL